MRGGGLTLGLAPIMNPMNAEMRCIAYHQFGDVSVLNVEMLPVPAVPEAGVLVEVHAASVNVIDSRARRHELGPLVNKTFPKIPGADFSGRVIQTGPGAKHFKVGDEVYGAANPFQGGAMAERIAVGEEQIAHKPAGLSWEEAAALPITGLAALYALRELGKTHKGAEVLIHGSTGGAGLMAIQIAKHLGGRVTTVSGSKGLALCRELGADEVLDYTAGPVEFKQQFEVIVNFSGHFPFTEARTHLCASGRFIEPSPSIPEFMASMVANPFRRQKDLMLQTEAHRADLEYLNELVTAGKLKVIVAETFPFAEARRAYAKQEAGGTVGKIVVNVA
jgi:NADPH:quinone reductase-like Zn-dependent oxidoreductase